MFLKAVYCGIVPSAGTFAELQLNLSSPANQLLSFLLLKKNIQSMHFHILWTTSTEVNIFFSERTVVLCSYV